MSSSSKSSGKRGAGTGARNNTAAINRSAMESSFSAPVASTSNNDHLEREADAVADRIASGDSAQSATAGIYQSIRTQINSDFESICLESIH